MKKNTDELQMLLELEHSLEESEARNLLDRFNDDEKVIINGLCDLFNKFVNRISVINTIFVISKILNVISVIFLVLLIAKVFPYYIVVILMLILNPILSIIFKKMLYSSYAKMQQLKELAKPYGLTLEDLVVLLSDKYED